MALCDFLSTVMFLIALCTMKSVFFYAVTESDLKFPQHFFFHYDHKILTALKKTRPKVIKLFFSFSTQLSMKFQLLMKT